MGRRVTVTRTERPSLRARGQQGAASPVFDATSTITPFTGAIVELEAKAAAAAGKKKLQPLPVTDYEPEPVFEVKAVARTKGVPGRKKKKPAKWTQQAGHRGYRQYPQAAMDAAVRMLLDREEYFLPDVSDWAAAIKVCERVNTDFSTKAAKCEIKHRTLLTHLAAAREGAVVSTPGVPKTIPQIVIDTWAGWVSLQGEDNACPTIDMALSHLWTLCKAAGVTVPESWVSQGLKTEWWRLIATTKSEGGYGYPDLKGRISKNLDHVRRVGENPVRIKAWYERMTADITAELSTHYEEWNLSFEVIKLQITRWWQYDEKGMQQDLGQGDGDLVLQPVWQMRPHSRSTGDRRWFTITQFLRGDGYAPPCDITIEGVSDLSPECYDAAPGHQIATCDTGMQNADRNLKSIQNFIRKYAPPVDGVGAYVNGEVNGPVIALFDNASIHIQAAPIKEIKGAGHLGGTLPSHTTRILMNLDNGFNRNFELGFKIAGGRRLMKNKKTTRVDLLGAIHEAWDYAATQTAKVDVCDSSGKVLSRTTVRAGKVHSAMVGLAPFGPERPLARLASEGRTLDDPNGDLGKNAASAKRLAAKQAAPTFKAQEELRARLAQVVAAEDCNLAEKARVTASAAAANSSLYEAVLPDGSVKRLSDADSVSFFAWKEKQAKKRERDALGTDGNLLTKDEYTQRLEKRDNERDAKKAKAAATAADRKERAEQKIKDAAIKEREAAERIDREEPVASVLKAKAFWTSNTEFVKAADMYDFIRANRTHLTGLDGYKSSFTKDSAFAFLKSAFSSSTVTWAEK